jgi:hypothetical protein
MTSFSTLLRFCTEQGIVQSTGLGELENILVNSSIARRRQTTLDEFFVNDFEHVTL